MNYFSTRDKSKRVNSSYAIKEGISPEGGLYVPESIPEITMQEIEKLSGLNYNGRAKYILSKFLTDFTADEINSCVDKAYANDKFDSPETAPIKKLNDSEYILELWHGPTCAFKDMALQLLPHLLTASLKKTGEKREAVILVATSGDTGKAALEGFSDVQGTKIMVFYPEDGVSHIQKLQMMTQKGGNVNVCGLYGNFDDAQNGVKAIFTDLNIKKELDGKGFMLSSANSINWGRLVPQIVYYFSAYADLLKYGEIINGEKINIAVPTGNFGNILAAYYAKRMGLPVNKLICASNSNDVLTEFIETGVYDRNRPFFTTISPSMDILISSNLERLLFNLYGNNDKAVSDLMDSLKKTGKYSVDAAVKSSIKEQFAAGSADDGKTMQTIRDIFEKYKYLCDTHTAVGVSVYEEYKIKTGDNTKTVIASTASPYKFSDAVLKSLKPEVMTEDDFKNIDLLCEVSGLKKPSALTELKNSAKRFEGRCNKADMPKELYRFLKIE